MAHNDPLERFLDAQAPVFAEAHAELTAGRKRSHWMWFIFPQLRGLGRSETARFFGIASRDEARAYLAHPVLGARLRELTAIVQRHAPTPLGTIFGSPDDLKFCSSMTLFAAVEELPASAGASVFAATLRAFGHAPDAETLRRLGPGAGATMGR